MGKITSQRLLIYENPIRDLTTINIELVEYIAHLHTFVPMMDPLDNIATKFNITES